ncbi:hypothetical protein SprV_0200522700 [Sparganum proliferum]
MEKIIKKALMQFLEQQHLLSDAQHGFQSGRSCLTNLLFTLERWTKARDEGNVVHAIYIDFKKAFDSVPHQRLLHKLRKAGIRGRLLVWIQSFLAGRSQRVQQRGDLILVYKIINGLEHGLSFEDMFQWHLSPSLRGHSMELRTTMSRLNLRSEFFMQRVLEKWNAFPQSVVEATSLQFFKKRLDDYLCPPFSLDSLNRS